MAPGKPKARKSKGPSKAKAARPARKAKPANKPRAAAKPAAPAKSPAGHTLCAATDPFGGPCQNTPRRPSKYCVIHSYLDGR